MKDWKEQKNCTFPYGVVDGSTVDLSNAVQSTDLVEDACFQLKDAYWCEKVIFCGNNLTLEGVEHICGLIADNPSITCIDISDNSLDEDSFAHLASSVANSDVTTLILNNTNLTNHSLEVMSGLSNSCKLQTIQFRNNHINDEGFRRLIFYLLHCDSITEVDVANNNITPLSLSIIADFLGELESVKKIDISGVAMDPFNGDKFKRLADAADCEICYTVNTNYDRDAELCKTAVPALNYVIFGLHEKYNTYHLKDDIEFTLSTKYPLKLSETEKQDIIQYPSILCGKLREIQRYLSTKKYKEDEKESEVISLILQNLPLFIAFLHLDPSLDIKNDQIDFSLQSQIPSSIGKIHRCGQLRSEIVALFASLVYSNHPKVIDKIIELGVATIIFDMYTLFPWNSILHYHCNSFFLFALGNENEKMLHYLLDTMKLPKCIISAMAEKNVGYHGWLAAIVKSLICVFTKFEEFHYWNEDSEWQTFIKDVYTPMQEQSTSDESDSD